MDQETKTLVMELQATPTDLARLVARVANRNGRALWVSRAEVTAWETRAPDAWQKTSTWLARRGFTIFVISPP